jgi:hypothetical protein
MSIYIHLYIICLCANEKLIYVYIHTYVYYTYIHIYIYIYIYIYICFVCCGDDDDILATVSCTQLPVDWLRTYVHTYYVTYIHRLRHSTGPSFSVPFKYLPTILAASRWASPGHGHGHGHSHGHGQGHGHGLFILATYHKGK